MKPVIFFSHRSTDKDRATLIVQAIEAGGELRTTYDVNDLRQGEEWKPQLYRWLARCDAGFVLLTRNVMEQPAWVLQEATILRARLIEEGAPFRLFLLIDADVPAHPNWKLFKPLELDAVLRLPNDATPAATGAAVNAAMSPFDPQESTYFACLERQLRDLLKPIVEQNETATLALGKRLRLADARWENIVGPGDAVERHAAQHLCQGDLGEFESLDALFNAIAVVPKREAKTALLHILRSYWIDLHPLAELSDVVGGRLPRLVVIRTAHAEQTLAMCADRQWGPYGTTPALLRVSGGNEPPEKADVLAAYRAPSAATRGDGPLDEGAAFADLNNAVQRRKRRFVVLLPTMSDIPSALDLAALFPMCSFIMPTTLDLRSRAAALGVAFVSLVGRKDTSGWEESDFVADFGDALARINAA